jgi:hypothetical protein
VCYLTLDDPLTHNQVVAYLVGLAAAGHRVHLLTFEPGLTSARRRHWREQMRALGIHWHGLRYHARPSLPATVFDTLLGAGHIWMWTRRYRLDVVHARNHIPAAMALVAGRLGRRPPALVFDIRGLMAEDREEAGRWRPGGIPSRLTGAVQNAAIRRAEQIIILTERARAALFPGPRRSHVHVIPCCANLERIAAAEGGRDDMRRALGLGGRTVMVYVGKFPNSSMPEAMADLHRLATQLIDGFHFLILTQGDGQMIGRALTRTGADPATYTVTSAPPGDVGAYLAASDFAITFTKPAPSTIAQSPTKLGEYLGAGLPVVFSAGVGDLDELISPNVGVRVADHSPDVHRRVITAIQALVDDPSCPGRCRQAAERSLSLAHVGIPRYLALYADIAAARVEAR